MRQSTRSYKHHQKRDAIRRTKKEHSDTIACRHYLVAAKRKCSCNACGGILLPGTDVVYRHEPREIICTTCAESKAVKWRPSLKWEAARQRKRRR
jgi:hypothetical protein